MPIKCALILLMGIMLVFLSCNTEKQNGYLRPSIENKSHTWFEYEVRIEGVEEAPVLVIDRSSSLFRIFVGFPSYLSGLRNACSSLPASRLADSCKMLHEYLEGIPVRNNQVNVSVDYVVQHQKALSVSHFQYYIAEALKNGKCRIVEKDSGKEVDRVRVGRWAVVATPEGGVGGRLFETADGKEILRTTEWIS